MAKLGRPGAAKGKKGATKGTGGHGKQALEGRGPTPKAEDRPYHKAHKAKQAALKAGAKAPKTAKPVRKGEFVAGRSGMGQRAISGEVLSGRNSVVEALKTKVPATALFIAQRIEIDEVEIRLEARRDHAAIAQAIGERGVTGLLLHEEFERQLRPGSRH